MNTRQKEITKYQARGWAASVHTPSVPSSNNILSVDAKCNPIPRITEADLDAVPVFVRVVDGKTAAATDAVHLEDTLLPAAQGHDAPVSVGVAVVDEIRSAGDVEGLVARVRVPRKALDLIVFTAGPVTNAALEVEERRRAGIGGEAVDPGVAFKEEVVGPALSERVCGAVVGRTSQ